MSLVQLNFKMRRREDTGFLAVYQPLPPALSDGSQRARGDAMAKTCSTPKLLVRAVTH